MSGVLAGNLIFTKQWIFCLSKIVCLSSSMKLDPGLLKKNSKYEDTSIMSFKNKQGMLLLLKPLDTFGKQLCPRSTLRVSQLLYKITNLLKFMLNRSSESGENNGKTHPCFSHISRCHDMCLKWIRNSRYGELILF